MPRSRLSASASRTLLGALGLVLLFGDWEAALRLDVAQAGLLPRPSELPAAWLGELSGGFCGCVRLPTA